MTTKPTTTTYPTFHVAEQQQYQQQTMSRVNTHELKTRLIPAYVPTSNNGTMTLQQQRQQQRQGQRQQQQQPHSDPLQNEEEEVISLDASSLPSFGSMRPDPNYDPAGDPMNPMNQKQFQKPFVPPSEIIIKTTVRGRRRKTMGRGEGKNEEQPQRRQQQRHSPLQPAAQQIQQRPENNQHPSPVLCWSQSPPPPLMTLIMDSPAPPQITTPTNSCTSTFVQHMYSAVSKSTTSTTRLSFEDQHQLNLHPSIYYDQQHRREESLSLKLIMNDIFHNDNHTTNTTTDNSNDDDVAQQQQEQEQEQQHKQRKGMVLRMFGRKMLRFKQKKIGSSNSNDVLGDNTDHNNDGTDIDRVFDAVVHSDIAVAAAVVVDNTLIPMLI